MATPCAGDEGQDLAACEGPAESLFVKDLI